MIDHSIPSDRRVCVFIDNASLLGAIKGLQIRYDFKRLNNWLLAQREGNQSRVYCGGGDSRSGFHNVLRHAGFEVVTVNSVRRPLEIAYDMCSMCLDCETLILVSGRPELAKIIPLLTKQGTKVELVFFEEFCSKDLLNTATTFRALRVDGLELPPRQGTEWQKRKPQKVFV